MSAPLVEDPSEVLTAEIVVRSSRKLPGGGWTRATEVRRLVLNDAGAKFEESMQGAVRQMSVMLVGRPAEEIFHVLGSGLPS